MEDREFAECIANGIITHCEKDEEIGKIKWDSHPKFTGVFLKHLLKGADTAGMLSCHVVKVEPGCMLDEHVHPGEWELHEVIRGEGQGCLGTKQIQYHSGSVVIIPQNTKHKVVAGRSGLILLAKFFPAMM
jgi:quercetin dioxygenase-like cupin family protein